jgi:hypothetical protein
MDHTFRRSNAGFVPRRAFFNSVAWEREQRRQHGNAPTSVQGVHRGIRCARPANKNKAGPVPGHWSLFGQRKAERFTDEQQRM